MVYFSTPVHFSAYFGGLAIGYYARIHNTTRCVPPKVSQVQFIIICCLQKKSTEISR